MKIESALEERIKSIGMEIYKSVGKEVPSVFNMKKWMGRILEWAMKDEDFKIRLFRFIDVLPVLKNDEVFVKILKEYFDAENTPTIMKQTVRRLSGSGFLPSVAINVIKGAVESTAYQFIAGENTHKALSALVNLRREGIAASIDLLGEEALSQREAQAYLNQYIELMRNIEPIMRKESSSKILDEDDHGSLPRTDISLKVTAFNSQIDPVAWDHSIQETCGALQSVFSEALIRNVSLTLDMEQYYFKNVTLAIFKQIMKRNVEFNQGGIVIQAYLKDSKQDLVELIDWARRNNKRILIRLVKGAYWDYETVVNRRNGWPVPVYTSKGETDLNYEELTRILLSNTNYVRPAIATHNIRSISHAIATANELGLATNAYEFQLIFGMAEPIRNALKNMGYRVRVYTPIGALLPGMAYLIRRLLENTYDDSFLRKAFYESEDIQNLLERPIVEKPSSGVEIQDFQNEPLTDFSVAANRARMTQALESVSQSIGRTLAVHVAGPEKMSERALVSVNPADPKQIVGKVSARSQDEIEAAVHSALKVFPSWGKLQPGERAEFLFSAAREMRKRRFDIAALEIFETGKSWKEADGDVAEAIDHLDYYAKESLKLFQDKELGFYPGEKNIYRHVPRGVGVVISPWNFPVAIPVGMISAALATGNCVLFKPSTQAIVCGRLIFDVLNGVGLPSGVLQFVPGSGAEIGEALISNPNVDFIAFTGSKEVGLNIIRLAGDTQNNQKSVKRVVAEMGGKNAIIVDDTADMDEAIKGAVESSIGFQGQKCSACSRLILFQSIADEFCSRFAEALDSIKIGPTTDPSNTMGPLIDENAYAKIHSYIKMGSEEAKSIYQGKRHFNSGYFVNPYVFGGVQSHSRLLVDEIFGPVITVIVVPDLDQALNIANSTEYSLTGGLFSRSPGNIERVQAEFRVGNLYINRKITGALVGRQPFGGFGMSGVGYKAGGTDYLVQFTNAKTISENTLRRGFAPSKERTKSD